MISNVIYIYTLHEQKFAAEVGDVGYQRYQADSDNNGKQIVIDVCQLRKDDDKDEYDDWSQAKEYDPNEG